MRVSDVLNAVRVLCNDVNGGLFTDEAVLPHFKIAYSELIEYCEENNIPFTNELSATYVITPAIFDIGGPTGSALPNDLVEIQGVYERTNGSQEDFYLMKRTDFLPKYATKIQQLVYWAWQKQQILFIGATTIRDVQINYIGTALPPITDKDTVITLMNSANVLNFRTAALSAAYIGENETRAEQLNGDASHALERMLNISTKGRQAIATRRRPFMARYKTTGGGMY